MNRTSLRKVVHILLVLVVLMLPGFGPAGSALVVVAMASTLAYEGYGQPFFARSLTLLIAIELLWAFDLGALSLPYATSAAVLTLTERFIAVPPLISREGWHFTDMIRSGMLAVAAATMMFFGSAMVEVIIYGRGMLFGRLLASWPAGHWWVVPAGCAAVLVLLRRIDIPFRRQITFNS